jgi:hypothetical protein
MSAPLLPVDLGGVHPVAPLSGNLTPLQTGEPGTARSIYFRLRNDPKTATADRRKIRSSETGQVDTVSVKLSRRSSAASPGSA